MELDIKKIYEIKKNLNIPIHLESKIGEKENMTIADFIEDEKALLPEEEAEKEEIKKMLTDMIEKVLTEREAEVIRSRFGLTDDVSKTLEEIGKDLNVTRARVKQIEKKAIWKLRRPKTIKEIEGYGESRYFRAISNPIGIIKKEPEKEDLTENIRLLEKCDERIISNQELEIIEEIIIDNKSAEEVAQLYNVDLDFVNEILIKYKKIEMVLKKAKKEGIQRKRNK